MEGQRSCAASWQTAPSPPQGAFSIQSQLVVSFLITSTQGSLLDDSAFLDFIPCIRLPSCHLSSTDAFPVPISIHPGGFGRVVPRSCRPRACTVSDQVTSPSLDRLRSDDSHVSGPMRTGGSPGRLRVGWLSHALHG